MNTFKLKAAAVLCATAIASSPVYAQDEITIATEAGYMPWNGTSASGDLIGFEIELVDKLCGEMEVTCNFVVQDFDGMIPALKQGRFDLAMSAMSITEERRKSIEFSVPYAITPSRFASLESSDYYDVLDTDARIVDFGGDNEEGDAIIAKWREALDGAIVGVSAGSTELNFAEANLTSSDVRSYDRTESLILDVGLGRVDVVLLEEAVLEDLLKAAEDPTAAPQAFGPGMTGGPFGSGIAFGVRQDSVELKAKLDAAINAAIADGTVTELSEQWFGKDIAPLN